MEEIVYKKYYRKADKHLNGRVKAHHGKRDHQKLKPALVWQYLLRCTDEKNAASAYDIMAFLADYGIAAERRSIYRDIEEINKMALLFDDDFDFDEYDDEESEEDRRMNAVTQMLEEDEFDDLKAVVYDKKMKGFYVKNRRFALKDIRLLTECIYMAKFISKSKARELVDIVCGFVSEHQAEELRHDAFLVDRTKTTNESVFANVRKINDAMSYRGGDDPHEPHKISFTYLTHTIDDIDQPKARRKGEKYIVSPYKLIINDGNYYLLAFDDKKKKLWTYRVDRMKGIEELKEERAGEEEFKKIDLTTYARRSFNMYSGEEKLITLRFINKLLSTAIERFGTKEARYTKCDDKHFTVTTKVEISKQFFGWLLGFGKEVKIVDSPEIEKEFTEYLDKIREMY